MGEANDEYGDADEQQERVGYVGAAREEVETHHVTSEQLLLGERAAGGNASALQVNFNDLTINSITAELLRWQSQCGSLKKENTSLRKMLQYSVGPLCLWCSGVWVRNDEREMFGEEAPAVMETKCLRKEQTWPHTRSV